MSEHDQCPRCGKTDLKFEIRTGYDWYYCSDCKEFTDSFPDINGCTDRCTHASKVSCKGKGKCYVCGNYEVLYFDKKNEVMVCFYHYFHGRHYFNRKCQYEKEEES